eukprot:TRINITY_DN35547_c0_g1_i1.p1 TRINITY_DN35547_c0_g1~~TRINITY_DN35547_c0_g1_i1.p1  ORF type:complete len:142 (+),score=32.53 TRINITY_DN35547_c0_g1_i1:53-478(+)
MNGVLKRRVAGSVQAHLCSAKFKKVLETKAVELTPFRRSVLALCYAVPKGSVVSYKGIADALQCGSCRAIGQALRNNPYAPVVPCHRVVGHDGKLTGFNGRRCGEALCDKTELLEKEGVPVHDGVVDQAHFVEFAPSRSKE